MQVSLTQKCYRCERAPSSLLLNQTVWLCSSVEALKLVTTWCHCACTVRTLSPPSARHLPSLRPGPTTSVLLGPGGSSCHAWANAGTLHELNCGFVSATFASWCEVLLQLIAKANKEKAEKEAREKKRKKKKKHGSKRTRSNSYVSSHLCWTQERIV